MIKVELTSERATADDPATVKIYDNGVLVHIVEAYIQRETGADGGLYNVVKLRARENEKV